MLSKVGGGYRFWVHNCVYSIFSELKTVQTEYVQYQNLIYGFTHKWHIALNNNLHSSV